MKALKIIATGASCACLFLSLFFSSAASRGQAIDNSQWGTQVNGLQMSISAVDSSEADVPEFQVAFRNAGEQDVTLNLGMMLANGKVQLPNRIRINLTDGSGKTRKLRFADKRYGFVAGRVDDYIVPLRAGSIYTLKLSLNQFWSPDTKEFALKLSTGKYQVTAQFEGGGASAVNLDMPGIKLMNFWNGKLQSNTLELER